MGDAPNYKDRQGRFDVAVWNPKDNKSGSVSLQRSRKSQDGSYVREKISFFPDEIDNLELAIANAKAHMRKEKMYPPVQRNQ